MIDGQNVFDQPIRNSLITMIMFKKFEQVKVMITQLVVCWTMIISIYFIFFFNIKK